TRYRQSELTLQMLAEEQGISAPHLSKMFREVMQMPITNYISQYRLMRAKEWLEQEETLKIHEVAEYCGFNDYPYFSRIFKRSFGISPLEYRDKYMSSR